MEPQNFGLVRANSERGSDCGGPASKSRRQPPSLRRDFAISVASLGTPLASVSQLVLHRLHRREYSASRVLQGAVGDPSRCS